MSIARGILIAAVLVIAGLPASANATAGKGSVELVNSLRIDSGSVRKVPGGFKLRLVTGSAVKTKSVTRKGLVGAKPLKYEEQRHLYFRDWRGAFDNETREAVIVLGSRSGKKITLKVSKPRYIRSRGVVVLKAMGSARKLPSRFGRARLSVTNDSWNAFTVHMNAYGKYGYCADGGYEGPSWTCSGTGDPSSTSPWNAVGYWNSWGSTQGGAQFWMSGHMDVHTSTLDYTNQRAELRGTQAWGWRGNALTIDNRSRYTSFLTSVLQCEKVPVSGTDPSLVGNPGGPLHVKLTSAGYGNQYVLDLNGYLSVGFPIGASKKKCH